MMAENWWSRAACADKRYREVDRKGRPVYSWDAENPRIHAVREAISVCHRCPVKNECLQYSFEAKEPAGVWGGIDAITRAEMITRTPRRSAVKRGEFSHALVASGS